MTATEKPPGVRQRLKTTLQPAIDVDKRLTEHLSVCASESSLCGKWRTHMRALEWSCHGIPWLGSSLVLLWFAGSSEAQETLLNILMALIVDLVLVALIKAMVRRARPANNHADMFATIGVDHYSFPSGHASRAAMLAYLFCVKDILGLFIGFFMFAWAGAVAVSRVLLGRHHVGDVVAGVLLGITETWLICLLWLGPDSTQNILHIFRSLESFHGADPE